MADLKLRREMSADAQSIIVGVAMGAHPIVRRIVGALHVGEDLATVRAAIRASLSPKGRKDHPRRRAAFRMAMCCHLHNRWLYQDVVGGCL